MFDLALDRSAGDLLIEGHRARITRTANGENVAQRLYVRMGLWQGEYVLDTTQGVPYLALFNLNDRDRFTRTMRTCAATCPGVASLDQFGVTFDANRDAHVNIKARAATGEPVSLDAFRVAA